MLLIWTLESVYNKKLCLDNMPVSKNAKKNTIMVLNMMCFIVALILILSVSVFHVML